MMQRYELCPMSAKTFGKHPIFLSENVTDAMLERLFNE